jgi:hypothetical protein
MSGKFDKKPIAPRPVSSHYINLPQGFTARIVVGRTPYAGIYTEGVSTCYVIVVEGRTRFGHPCFSLTHADATVTEAFIKAEKTWAGEGSKVSIYKHKNEHLKHPIEDTLAAIIRESTVKPFREDKDTIVVSMSGDGLHVKFSHRDSDTIPPLVNHPSIREIYGIHKLNAMVSSLDMGSLRVPDSKNSDQFLLASKSINQYIRKEHLIYGGEGEEFIRTKHLAFTEGASLVLGSVGHALEQANQKPADIRQIASYFYAFLCETPTYSKMTQEDSEVLRDVTGYAECFCYINDQIELLNLPEISGLYAQAKRYCAQTSNKIPAASLQSALQTPPATPQNLTRFNTRLVLLYGLAIACVLQQDASPGMKVSQLCVILAMAAWGRYALGSGNKTAEQGADVAPDDKKPAVGVTKR